MADLAPPDRQQDVTTRHADLLAAYMAVLRNAAKPPALLWLPAFSARWLGFVGIPVVTAAIRMFTARHIDRVLTRPEDAYRLRQSVNETVEDRPDWKTLVEQTSLMKSALPAAGRIKWLAGILAAFGPGLLVGVIALNLQHAEPAVVQTLMWVAAINTIIGFFNVALCRAAIGRRRLPPTVP